LSEDKGVWFEPTFNRSVKIRSRDHRISSNGGALLLREVDQRLGLTEELGRRLYDRRNPRKIRYTLTELLRESIYAQAMGYRSDDDSDVLAHDPAMRVATWDRPGEHVLEERLASQPTQSRLIDALANRKGNLEEVRSALPAWVEKHLRASGKDRAVVHGTLDVDSLPVVVYGRQPGAAFNGYYNESVYHPLVAGFSVEGNYDHRRLGDGFVHAILRGGRVHTATGALRFIREALRRCSGFGRVLDVRIDAGFVEGPVVDGLTDDGVRFVGRVKNNAVLDRLAAPYLTRPPGRPPKEGYEDIRELGNYQAESWRYPQRVILVVVDRPDPKTGQLNLFPHHFFLVTSWAPSEKDAMAVLQHYRNRGTFEDRIGELQNHVAPQLSHPRFEENEAALLLGLLSYNLLSILRGELEGAFGSGWDIGRVQRSVLKAGARITKGGRRLFVDLAQAVTGFWHQLSEAIRRWRFPSPWNEPTGPTARPWTPPPSHAHLQLVLRE